MRYRFMSVFRLGGWSPLLPTRFLVSRGTLDPTPRVPFRLPGFHRLWPSFPAGLARFARLLVVRNPGSVARPGLGSAPFARRYLGYLC